MKASLWLAWRELINRKSAFLTGAAMVAVAVTLCTATELVSRAREAAVAAQIDHIGPSLRLIPAGKTASDLARFDLGSNSFTIDHTDRIYSGLSSSIRVMEERLLLKVPIEGRMAPAIGIDSGEVISPFEILRRLGDREVALGVDLAQKLGKKVDDEISVKDRKLRIAAVLPETASAEDVAIFLPLTQLQNLFDLPDTVNEIRIFPAPGVEVERIASYIRTKHPEVNVINMYRGDTAEHDMGHSLHQHRRVLYVITGLVIALCIFIWSYLNANERRLELATVVAVGGTGTMVLSMLVIRAAVVGLLGALVGYLAGASIALVQDFESASSVVLSGKLLFVMSSGAVALSIIGAFPASILSAFRKHVTVLQEW